MGNVEIIKAAIDDYIDEGSWDALLGDADTGGMAEHINAALGWDFLMEMLDRNYPQSVFPTLPDDETRDPGPRIVSLIRQMTTALKTPKAETSWSGQQKRPSRRT
jgi:hypothetical protein